MNTINVIAANHCSIILSDLTVVEAQKVVVAESSNEDDEVPPAKMCKLFSNYRSKVNKKRGDLNVSVRAELTVCATFRHLPMKKLLIALSFGKSTTTIFPGLSR